MSLVALSLTAVRTRRVPSWSELRAVFKEWRERASSRYELRMLAGATQRPRQILRRPRAKG
jgi:hypothetical protein